MKPGLIISLFSPDRNKQHIDLENSLDKDLEVFDLLKLDPADSLLELTSAYAVGYDYALEHGYEFVGHIDDDLIVPGGFTFLMELLNAKPKAAGFGGVQEQFVTTPWPRKIDTDTKLLFNPHCLNFHGAAVYRTKELYPVVDQWRTMPVIDQHTILANLMMESGKTLGFATCVTSYYRRKVTENNDITNRLNTLSYKLQPRV